MLVDLHMTPKELTPNALANAAKSAGLHGAVITDTHRTDRLMAFATELRALGLKAYAGVEMTLEKGSIVFIPRDPNGPFASRNFAPAGLRWVWQDAVSVLEGLEGVVLAGHPYCRELDSAMVDVVYYLPTLHAIETRVARGRPIWDMMADEAVDRRNIARVGTCGGDPEFLGRSMTFVEGEQLSQAELVDALLSRNCWPIESEGEGQTRSREEAFSEGPPRGPRGDDDGDRPRFDGPRGGGDRGPRGGGDRGPPRGGDRGGEPGGGRGGRPPRRD